MLDNSLSVSTELTSLPPVQSSSIDKLSIEDEVSEKWEWEEEFGRMAVKAAGEMNGLVKV